MHRIRSDLTFSFKNCDAYSRRVLKLDGEHKIIVPADRRRY
jgi:hypothetical protein